MKLLCKSAEVEFDFMTSSHKRVAFPFDLIALGYFGINAKVLSVLKNLFRMLYHSD